MSGPQRFLLEILVPILERTEADGASTPVRPGTDRGDGAGARAVARRARRRLPRSFPSSPRTSARTTSSSARRSRLVSGALASSPAHHRRAEAASSPKGLPSSTGRTRRRHPAALRRRPRWCVRSSPATPAVRPRGAHGDDTRIRHRRRRQRRRAVVDTGLRLGGVPRRLSAQQHARRARRDRSRAAGARRTAAEHDGADARARRRQATPRRSAVPDRCACPVRSSRSWQRHRTALPVEAAIERPRLHVEEESYTWRAAGPTRRRRGSRQTVGRRALVGPQPLLRRRLGGRARAGRIARGSRRPTAWRPRRRRAVIRIRPAVAVMRRRSSSSQRDQQRGRRMAADDRGLAQRRRRATVPQGGAPASRCGRVRRRGRRRRSSAGSRSPATHIRRAGTSPISG